MIYIYIYYTQNAVLDSKAAAPLATAGINALCPLLVKSTIEVLGKNAEKTPMDFVSIRRLLTKTCQARSQCTCVTSTKVQMLTQRTVRRVLNLLASLV